MDFEPPDDFCWATHFPPLVTFQTSDPLGRTWGPEVAARNFSSRSWVACRKEGLEEILDLQKEIRLEEIRTYFQVKTIPRIAEGGADLYQTGRAARAQVVSCNWIALEVCPGTGRHGHLVQRLLGPTANCLTFRWQVSSSFSRDLKYTLFGPSTQGVCARSPGVESSSAWCARSSSRLAGSRSAAVCGLSPPSPCWEERAERRAIGFPRVEEG